VKKSAELNFADRATYAGGSTSAKRGAAKSARKSRRPASAANRKRRTRITRKLHRASGIRETEEARALLEKQLHSLYWWVFNACKMKGFIRAKGLFEAAERQPDASCNPHSSNPKGSQILPKKAGGK
jgi:hypothetical protein